MRKAENQKAERVVHILPMTRRRKEILKVASLAKGNPRVEKDRKAGNRKERMPV